MMMEGAEVYNHKPIEAVPEESTPRESAPEESTHREPVPASDHHGHDYDLPRQNALCCGCCCDFRRASIISSVISMVLIVTAMSLNFFGGVDLEGIELSNHDLALASGDDASGYNLTSSDDDWFNSTFSGDDDDDWLNSTSAGGDDDDWLTAGYNGWYKEAEEFNDFLRLAQTTGIVIAAVVLVASSLSIIGALRYNIYLVGVNVVALVAYIAINIIFTVLSIGHFNDVFGGMIEMKFTDPSIILRLILQITFLCLWVYPHVGFIFAVRSGNMSRGTYARESSCCCG